MSGTGGNAQDRRRTNRAAARRLAGSRDTFNLSATDANEIRALVAAATGSTSLPLSDQDVAWDASAADKRVRDWAGAEDAPNAKYGSAFFFKDGDGESFGDYKLGFADVVDGKLTAVWRGITAVAGVLQGARGGVEGISDAETSSIKGKVEDYYAKAAKQFDDDSIKVPWAADGESAAETEELGGKPKPGTPPDKRLKENKGAAELAPEDAALAALHALDASPEDLALAQVEEYQYGILCECHHAYAKHDGANGACGHSDGRGACRCGGFIEFRSDAPAEIVDAFLTVRPDLATFRMEVSCVVEGALKSLSAAAGDVAWGPEEGFNDLLCDVNEQLADGAHGAYFYDEPGCCWYGPVACDASVKLDKVLISDRDGWFVAPISIDKDGEPVLSGRADWVPVESGWIEQADEMSMSAGMRVALRDFVLSKRDTAALTADGGVELPAALTPGERLPERQPSPAAPEAELSNGPIGWTATFVPEGVLTEDGRAFAPDSLTWRELPLTLMAMTKTSAEGGHDGAEVAGRIDNIWREGQLVKASGIFDEQGQFGAEIARMVADGTLRGLSVDIAPLEWERTPRGDWFDEDGNWAAKRGDDGEWMPLNEQAAPGSIEEQLERLFDSDAITVITKGVIGMATVCPFPAFADANIALTASGAVWRYTAQGGFIVVAKPEALVAAAGVATGDEATIESEGSVESLTAAVAGLAPARPPAEWFDDPQLEGPTPLTITDEGRIFGHAWTWDTCHISFEGCVLAPHSATNYAYFLLGEIECESGDRIACGSITMDTSHASQRLSRVAAARHYDHTGTVAAHVTFGEDEHGGWLAGAINPDLPEGKLRVLQGAKVSGDWRDVDGNLELVGLLAVNVPGFPVPRPRYFAAGDEENGAQVLALTAAGILCGCEEVEDTDAEE